MTDYVDKNRLDRLEEAHAALEADVMVLKLAKADARADLIELFRRMERLEANIAALEPPATPAQDPVCAECGHEEQGHGDYCKHWTYQGGYCRCPQFVPTAEPDLAPVDPVLVAACAEAVKRLSGYGGCIGVVDAENIVEMVRFTFTEYGVIGRDGAR